MRAVVVCGCLVLCVPAVGLAQQEEYSTKRGYVACADNLVEIRPDGAEETVWTIREALAHK